MPWTERDNSVNTEIAIGCRSIKTEATRGTVAMTSKAKIVNLKELVLYEKSMMTDRQTIDLRIEQRVENGGMNCIPGMK